jgi:hypothetical protein
MMQREGDDGREWFFCEGDPKISTNWKEKNPKDAALDPDGIQRTWMDKTSWFKWFVCYS